MSIPMLSTVFANTLAATVSRLPLPAIWTAGNAQQRTVILGVSFAILSNVLFGVLYAYSSFLAPLSGTQVFIWRMLAMWVVLLGYLLISGRLGLHIEPLRVLKGTKQWAWLLLPTPIFLSQFWLFMWAPVNGQGVQTAMGYFLFPLMMVVFGCILFGEKLSRLQWLAVGFAALGVGSEIVRTQSISWATLWVCGTYPVYYILRRLQGIGAVTGLLVDLTICAPFALGYLFFFAPSSLALVSGSAFFIMMIAGLGVLSVWAMKTNVDASQMLPVNVYGMMSYLEPALLFVLAITVLGNPFESAMIYSYGLIWVGIACLIAHGIRQLRQARRNIQSLAKEPIS
ncbi:MULTISPECIES: EamA family transporter RarD [unclassified Psychrobacter]|uniref:EamA family transporter RarD n=1 Tax=unclassified Psychrobacter TaxID=196806 RepID=UPI0025B4019E|nr:MULTISPECIES: EamA family transporter RarD [unclassified Psychrobacter]MDN3454399.1 EamA family transporter RarD [Psychrobacter sp. APC 3350]MDN3503595.1 EamA family transporter RarD [Psychrobacter sp. 5A.1]